MEELSRIWLFGFELLLVMDNLEQVVTPNPVIMNYKYYKYYFAFLIALVSPCLLSGQELKHSDLASVRKSASGYTSYVTKDGSTLSIGDRFVIGKPWPPGSSSFRFLMKGPIGMPVDPDAEGIEIEIKEIGVGKALGGAIYTVFKCRSQKLNYTVTDVDEALFRGEILNVGISVVADQDATENLSGLAAPIAEKPAQTQSRQGSIGIVAADVKQLEVDNIADFREGFAIVYKGQSQAIIDSKGNIVVPFNTYLFNKLPIEYGAVPVGFVNGSCVVKSVSTNAFGIIDTKGKLIVPCDNAVAFPFDEAGIATVVKDNKYYFIERSGKRYEVPAVFRRRVEPGQGGNILRLFDPGASQTVAAYGLVNKKFTSRGVSIGATKEGFGVYDKSGQKRGSGVFRFARHFSDGLAAVGNPNEFGELKWGFVNESGEIVIPLQFSIEPGDFSGGLAFVTPVNKSEFRHAYIDKSGSIKIRLNFDVKISPFHPDICKFQGNYAALPNSGNPRRRFLLIDQSGNDMSPFLDQLLGKMTPVTNVSDANKYQIPNGQLLLPGGLYDLDRNLLIPSGSFDELSAFDPVSGLAKAMKGGTRGYINTAGEFVITIGRSSKW